VVCLATMRTIDEYLALPYTVRIASDQAAGGYVASVDELPGCLTQAETLAEAKRMIQRRHTCLDRRRARGRVSSARAAGNALHHRLGNPPEGK
jgi:hypothetical protein